MPIRPSRPCAAPRCPAIVTGRYCPQHAYLADDRPSAARRGYGAAHRAMRARVLAEEPACLGCGAPGTPSDHADHIRPLGRGGTNARSNYARLCHSCHSRKTVMRDGGFGRPSESRKSFGPPLPKRPRETFAHVAAGDSKGVSAPVWFV